MVKLEYNNCWEKGKWKFTQWFIDNYVKKDDVVLDAFAGLGNITKMYCKKAKLIAAFETDPSAFGKLEKLCQEYSNLLVFYGDSLDYVKFWKEGLSSFPYNIVDLDPWSNANKHIEVILDIMIEGYLIFTSGEPYALSRFKGRITRYGGEPITDWKLFPEALYNRFIVPTANNFNKEVELLDYYSSPRICRLLVKIHE